MRYIQQDTTRSREWEPTTCFEERVLAYLDTIAGNPNFPVELPQYAFDSNDCWAVFPRNAPAINGSPQIIYMPTRILRDASAGEELVLFMILHEIGHEVQAVDDEYEADAWAARVGFALYYGDKWTPEFAKNTVKRVVEQLERYQYSQFRTCLEWQASNCQGGLNCYPELDCRIANIKGSNVVNENGLCISGFPEQCWNSAASDDRLDPTSYPIRHCGTSACTRLRDGIVLCDITQAGEKLQAELNRTIGLCSKYPSLCERKLKDLDRRERRAIERFMNASRTAAERIRRSGDRISRMRRTSTD